MGQVLDLVELLKSVEDHRQGHWRIEWRLASAGTNSPPLTVRTVAFPRRQGECITELADQTVLQTESYISSLLQGSYPEGLSRNASIPLKRMCERSRNGIARTDISIRSGRVVSLCLPGTRTAIATIRGRHGRLGPDEVDTHTEFGSIEGLVCGVTRWGDQRALRVIERLSKQEVTCVLEKSLSKHLGEDLRWYEAWKGRQFTLQGIMGPTEVSIASILNLPRKGNYIF